MGAPPAPAAGLSARDERVLRFLLDEHYPGWLAVWLTESGVDSVAVVLRDDLRGADDTTVLRAASGEERVVVTEDVATFSIAMAAIPDHTGVVFCHHRRFPRTRPGLDRLGEALLAFAESPPAGASSALFVWWLSN